MANRKRKWSATHCETILQRLGEGEWLSHICADEDLPSYGIVMDWIGGRQTPPLDKWPELYARARALHEDKIGDLSASRVEEIAETDPQQARVVLDTRKWLLSKKYPNTYGDRAQIDLGGAEKPVAVEATAQVDVSALSDEERARLRALARKAMQKR